MVKAEIGNDLTTSTAENASLNRLIDGVQESLCLEYDWPFLETRGDISIGVGGSTGTFPTTINVLKSFTVEAKWVDWWYPVNYGVGGKEYNVYDTEAAEAADRILKWRWSNSTTMEFWPAAQTAQTVRITGQKKPTPLDGDAVVATLDGLLITYFAAAELATRYKVPSAGVALGKAQQRLTLLRKNQAVNDTPFIMGQRNDAIPVRRRIFALTG